MMKLKLVGVESVVAKFKGRSRAAPRVIEQALTKFVIDLQRHVMEDKLSGQVLNRVTGTLRRSITQRVERNATWFLGIVGTNVEYARIHEYGGDVTVKAHLRTIKQAFGKPLKTPVTVNVQEYVAHYPERSFLRSALKDMAPQLKGRMEAALNEVAK